jgi:hypothetical protein
MLLAFAAIGVITTIVSLNKAMRGCCRKAPAVTLPHVPAPLPPSPRTTSSGSKRKDSRSPPPRGDRSPSDSRSPPPRGDRSPSPRQVPLLTPRSSTLRLDQSGRQMAYRLRVGGTVMHLSANCYHIRDAGADRIECTNICLDCLRKDR